MGASDSTCSLPTAATPAGTEQHAKDGRVHGAHLLRTPGRGRRTRPMPCGGGGAWRSEVNASPRGVGTLRVDIQAGDPLASLFHEQKREQRAGRDPSRPEGSGIQATSPARARRNCFSALDTTHLIDERSRRRRCKHRPRAPTAMQCSATGTARSGEWSDDGITTRRCACSCI
jgi:hypothetical protein